jgi:beta-glucosidase
MRNQLTHDDSFWSLLTHLSPRFLPHPADLAAKGLILAHAEAFRAWESAGRPGDGCGITLNGDARLPYNASDPADVAAAERALEWQACLFADPIHFGRWPSSIDAAVGERLAAAGGGWALTAEEVALVNGTHDGQFFMNTYTSGWTKAGVDAGCGWNCDAAADSSAYDFKTGEPIGTPSSNGWLFNYGPGIGELMTFYNGRYPGLAFIVTENGWGNATAATVEEDLLDYERCGYFRDYIGNMSAYAAKNDIDVAAYFAWSLMDNYEWADGFTTRFGLTYVDYDSQVRTPKLSAAWFQEHVNTLKALPTDGQPLPACEDVAAAHLLRVQQQQQQHSSK